MRSGTNTATLARGAFVFDRVEHQGWDPETAACVSIAMHPFDQTRAGGKAERAIRPAARRLAREVRDLPEREALVAALGALVTYIALARKVRDRTYESWWMQVAETIERRLACSGQAAAGPSVDIYTPTEREALRAAGIDPADTPRVAAYVIEHPSCMPAHVAAGLGLDVEIVGFHLSYAIARGLLRDGEITAEAVAELGLQPPG